MLDVVIQIVSHKTKRYLPDCLDSVIADLKNSGITYKILILENGSGEDLSDIERRYKNEPIAFYYSDKNLGFGAGHNFLSNKEKGSYLFALNPDTIVSNGAIKKLFSFMEAHQEAGLCGPRIEQPLGFRYLKWTFWPKQFTARRFFEKFLHIHILRNTNVLEFNPIHGSALFFRRKAFEAVGGFDETFFLYFEEGDICNSLKMEGWKIFFIYDAKITHFYYQSEAQPQNIKFYEESKAYFYKKWPQGDIK
jgi:GT2 family glycosyltransferase